MSSKIKIPHVFALLAAALMLFSVIVSSIHNATNQSSPIVTALNSNTQTAQASGSSGSVLNFSSCPASKDLFTDMMAEFSSRISSINLPSDATTNIAVGGRPFLRTWVSGLDLSGAGISNMTSFTLISPRHAVTAWHLHYPTPYAVYLGQKVRFLGSDGNLVTVTVVGIEEVGNSDLALVVFDQDLPSTVAYYPVLSDEDVMNYLPPFFPVLYYDQNGDDLIRIGNPIAGGIALSAYPSSSPFYPFGLELDVLTSPYTLVPYAYPSDSSHPAFFLINNTLAIASTQTSGGGATSVGAHIPELNQAMTELDQGLSSPPSNSYQVTTIDLSCFSRITPVTPTTISSQTVNINKTDPINTAVAKVSYTRTNPAVTTGFSIDAGNVGGVFAIDADGQITIANTAALKSQNDSYYPLNILMSETWPAPHENTDDVRGLVTVNITIPVIVPLVLTPIGNKSVLENNTLTFTISATDQNVQSLIYSASGLPSGATFDASTRTFTWKPVSAQMGDHAITFQVADHSGATDSETITVTVNHNPTTTVVPIVISAVSSGTPVQTSATITWTTDKSSSSKVDYGLTSSYGSSTALSSVWVKSHSQTLSNLLPGTTYHYRVSSNDPLNELGMSSDQTLTTASNNPVNIPSSNRPPVAAAGLDQTITLPASASLSASASSDPDGDTMTYSWSKISGPGTVTFSNSSSITPTVTFSTSGTYVLQVSVSDGTGSSTDQVSVVVNSILTSDTTAPAITSFTIPATASSLTVPITTLTASDDIGVTSYMVTESSTKPALAAVGWSGSVPAAYTFSSAGSKTLYAWAKDAAGNISSSLNDTVVITLPNRPPIANAGLDLSITLPASASLSASGSSDPDGNILSYLWSKVSGPGTVSFSSTSSISPTVTFSAAGTYVLEVSVSDGSLSASDQVTVNADLVQPVTYTLVSYAGSNGSIDPLGTATVNAGSNESYVITPANGYQVGNVVVDGSNVSLTGHTYSFTNINANHTISVTFTTIVTSQPAPYTPTPIVTYTPNDSTTVVTSQSVKVDPIQQLSLLTETSTDMTFREPPTIPEFLLSYVTDKVTNVTDFVQYAVDRIIDGMKKTLKL